MRRSSILLSFLAVLIFLGFWTGVYSLSLFFPNSKETLNRAGFDAPVTLIKDSYGVWTIDGAGRAEVIMAQGLQTARDRFFQMDLIRRKMSGRLSEILGAKAIEIDILHRKLGFFQVAQKGAAMMDSSTKNIWDSYTQGVNSYLQNEMLPWEIKLLGYRPEPWRVEDGLLVVLSMFEALNDPENEEELAYNELKLKFPPSVINFLTWDFGFLDAPLKAPKGFPFSVKVPSRDEIDLRAQSNFSPDAIVKPSEVDVFGSNAWVVSGKKTISGKPLLAGDPHLNLAVPNIWYRVDLRAKDLNVRGVTVPGIPGVVIGRNEYLAWSFTNSRSDVQDFIELEPDFNNATLRFQGKTLSLLSREEVIKVKKGESKKITVLDSPWGPVMEEEINGAPTKKRILQWTALDPLPLSKLNPIELNTSENLEQFWERLSRWGGPVQNILVATKDNHIGWGIVGKIPLRAADFGRFSTDLKTDSPWKGTLAWNEMPRAVDPIEGFIGSGNQNLWIEPLNRERLGHDWPNPARGFQIRELLSQGEAFSVESIEAMQNHIFSPVHMWYRDRLLSAIKRADLREVAKTSWVEAIETNILTWDGKVTVASSAYPFLKEFRLQVQKNCLAPFVRKTVSYRQSDVMNLVAKDSVVKNLLSLQPHHLLSPEFTSWDALILTSAVQAAQNLVGSPIELKDITWGKNNISKIRHPFSSQLPAFLGSLINFPEREMSGDGLVIRVNKPTNGASMRMVIDLSDYKNSKFSQPGGQSGFFLSPNYRDLFDGWYRGQGISFESENVIGSQRILPVKEEKK